MAKLAVKNGQQIGMYHVKIGSSAWIKTLVSVRQSSSSSSSFGGGTIKMHLFQCQNFIQGHQGP